MIRENHIMSTVLEYDKLNNIRDLGGMKAVSGRRIKKEALIRCGHLVDLSREDVRKLAELADTIVDFRTDKERAEKSSDPIPDVSFIHIPIVDSLTAGISREEESDKMIIGKMLLNPDAAKEYMCDMYRSFATQSALRQYGAFLRILLEDHKRAVLWHCTAGKDRAGIASAIVEKLLGVSDEDIINDYLFTNICLEDDIVFLTRLIKKEAKTDSPLADESLRYLFSAQREYIAAFIEEAGRLYSDFDDFAKKGLGLFCEDITRLRDKYLEDI